jgi:nicotinate-nucleotide pyrophosphorylase
VAEKKKDRPSINLESIATPRVNIALTEDVGFGDISTAAAVPEDLVARAVILAKEAGYWPGLRSPRSCSGSWTPLSSSRRI